MNTDLLKKYGLIGIAGALVLYGIYLMWFIYSAVYQPLVVESTAVPDSDKYEIPDAQIEKVKNLLKVKSENRVDVSSVRNPFSTLNTNDQADVDIILDSPTSIDELGRPE